MHIKTLLALLVVCTTHTLKPFILMLQPGGTARHPGRAIHGSFERGLSIQLAEQLKELLERKDPSIQIIIPRFQGQTTDPLEHAAIANRVHVDAYIALMLYEQQESNPQLALYTYAADPSDVLKTMNKKSLQFLPFDQAHIGNHHTSYRMADMLLSAFKAKPLFTITGDRVHALPLKNLMGITAPSIAIELSVPNTKKIKEYAQSLAHAFESMLNAVKQWNPPS